jgi:cyanate lyase
MTRIMKPLSRHLADSGLTVDDLIHAAGLERRRVQAIVKGQYTPSPSERRRLAAALGVRVDSISWGHSVPVEHLRGNGPQSGRST